MRPSNDRNLWMAFGGVPRGGRTFPGMICSPLQFRSRTGVDALVREGTPVLKLSQETPESKTLHVPAAVGGSMLDELAQDGGCWRSICKASTAIWTATTCW